MLDHKLRQDRHPKHASEVRESILPRTLFLLGQVESNHHKAMDGHLPSMMLFPHEDILACTLAYIRAGPTSMRIAELKAGQGDPGRPSYEEADDNQVD